jgi:hypothetical protein
MEPNRKEILFKMWSQLGPSLESFKYLGISGESNYKLLLAEFLGLPGNTSEKKLISLEKHIKDTCNEFLSLTENSPCNGTLRMIGNDALASSFLSGQPGKRYNQLKGLFAYRVPEDFVCEDLETYSDIEEIYRVDECFTDDCIRDSINKLKSHIRKVYGDLVLNNIELYSEDNVIGDIPLKKYS